MSYIDFAIGLLLGLLTGAVIALTRKVMASEEHPDTKSDFLLPPEKPRRRRGMWPPEE